MPRTAYRWVHDGSQAIYRDDGSVDYFLGFMTDITERRSAQDQRGVAEERFRTIVEHNPGGDVSGRTAARALRRAPVYTFVSPQINGARLHPGGMDAVPASGCSTPSRRPERRASESDRMAAGERTYRQDYR